MSVEATGPDPLGMRLSERLYRVCLHLYPRRFRRDYADEMVMVFRHRWHTLAGAARGVTLFSVWSFILRDLVHSVPNARRQVRGRATERTRVVISRSPLRQGRPPTGDASISPHGGGRRRRPGHGRATDWLASLAADVRYAMRGFKANPGFTTIALLTLALGIGANAAIFGVVNAVVIRPLPFPESSRMVRIGPSRWLSAQQVVGLEDQTDDYQATSAVGRTILTLAEGDSPELCLGAVVGAGHLEVFGMPPLLGRGLRAEDSEPGREPVALITHDLWARAFSSDRDIIGRSIRLEGHGEVSRTVVGVLPAGYRPFDWQPQVFVPIDLDVGTHDYESNYRYWLLGRLRPGISLGQARAELRTAVAWLAEGEGALFLSETAEQIDIITLHEDRVGDVRSTLWIVLAAVGVVLLIACTNVANLLLARSGSRQREFAIRVAIGAGRGRVARQVLTETVVLGLLGGGVGLLAAFAGLSGLASLLPEDVPRSLEIGMDIRVLVFTLLVSVLAGLAFGLVPCLRLSRSLEPAMRQDAAGAGGMGRGRHRLNSGLVAAEIALSVILVSAAGLLGKSLWVLQEVDPGFTLDNLYSVQLTPPLASYSEESELRAFYRDVLDAIRGVPGVRSVGAINARPLTEGTLGVTISADGSPVPDDVQPEIVSYRVVTPGYVETMGIPLLDGRTLMPSDRDGVQPVGMVNSTLADWLWPGESAVGKQLDWSDGELWFTVVGVVGDVHQNRLSTPVEPEAYVAYEQDTWLRALHVMIKAEPGWAGIDAVREAAGSVDRTAPISSAGSMRDVVSRSMATPRSYALLFSLLAFLALGLGAIGVFGVLSYTVSQRTHEIGVRMALGARRNDVIATVMRSGLTPVALGLALGLVAAVLSTRLVAGLLFGVAPTDPMILGAVTVALGVVAAFACLLPALRAARVDPALSLRQD